MDGGDGRGQGVTRLQAGDLDALAAGAVVLGCGGGGRATSALSALRRLGDALTVPVTDLLDPRVRTVAAVGLVGSTTVLEEKTPSGDELPTALAALTQWSGTAVDALVSAQIGGVTPLAAALAAHQVGLPLVDADLVGRATPRLDQFTLFSAGPFPITAAAATTSGLRIVVDAPTPRDLETVWREAVSHSGGWAAFAVGPLPVGMLHDRVIPGSVSRAVRTGAALASAGGSGPAGSGPAGSGPAGAGAGSAAEAFAAAVDGRVVAVGRVLDVDRAGDGVAFVRSSAAVLDSRTGAVARLEAGSEYVHCLVDGEPVASTPSLIVVLDARSLDPIATDRLRPGVEIAVVVLPADPWWWASPERSDGSGPRSFGIDADVVPEVAR